MDVGAGAAQDLEGAVVGGRLDHGRAALAAEEVPGEEAESLQRPVHDQDAGRVDPVARADPLAQRPEAAGRVGEHRRGVGIERPRRSGAHVGHRQEVGCGDAAGEGDRDRSHAIQTTGSPQPSAANASAASRAASVGLLPTRTPCCSSASFFAWAVPDEPEMIAPACPIVLPGGAWNPAM